MSALIHAAAVALGGATGALARHGVYLATARWIGVGFPYATIIVNLAGSFLMGALVGALALRWTATPTLRLFLTTGVLGAFTTFSTFSLDVWTLIERGRTLATLLYVAASLGLGLTALALGLALARRLL